MQQIIFLQSHVFLQLNKFKKYNKEIKTETICKYMYFFTIKKWYNTYRIHKTIHVFLYVGIGTYVLHLFVYLTYRGLSSVYNTSTHIFKMLLFEGVAVIYDLYSTCIIYNILYFKISYVNINLNAPKNSL